MASGVCERESRVHFCVHYLFVLLHIRLAFMSPTFVSILRIVLLRCEKSLLIEHRLGKVFRIWCAICFTNGLLLLNACINIWLKNILCHNSRRRARRMVCNNLFSFNASIQMSRSVSLCVAGFSAMPGWQPKWSCACVLWSCGGTKSTNHHM